jgi:hypothetical protein
VETVGEVEDEGHHDDGDHDEQQGHCGPFSTAVGLPVSVTPAVMTLT